MTDQDLLQQAQEAARGLLSLLPRLRAEMRYTYRDAIPPSPDGSTGWLVPVHNRVAESVSEIEYRVPRITFEMERHLGNPHPASLSPTDHLTSLPDLLWRVLRLHHPEPPPQAWLQWCRDLVNLHQQALQALYPSQPPSQPPNRPLHYLCPIPDLCPHCQTQCLTRMRDEVLCLHCWQYPIQLEQIQSDLNR